VGDGGDAGGDGFGVAERGEDADAAIDEIEKEENTGEGESPGEEVRDNLARGSSRGEILKKTYGTPDVVVAGDFDTALGGSGTPGGRNVARSFSSVCSRTAQGYLVTTTNGIVVGGALGEGGGGIS
jgi:hypothetical protein